jgi:hypothetical protein
MRHVLMRQGPCAAVAEEGGPVRGSAKNEDGSPLECIRWPVHSTGNKREKWGNDQQWRHSLEWRCALREGTPHVHAHFRQAVIDMPRGV